MPSGPASEKHDPSQLLVVEKVIERPQCAFLGEGITVCIGAVAVRAIIKARSTRNCHGKVRK